MINQVRYDNSDYPLFRVLHAATFAADGSGPWTVAQYFDPESTATDNGIEFLECERQCLPGIGTATLKMEYGSIDGIDVVPLDLKDKHIRIQAARRPSGNATPAWRTIWVGRCEWQDDAISSGSATLRGTRTYRCVDLLYAYTRGYVMDRHANYALTGALAYGHPGYNYQKDAPSVVVGNKESTGSGYSGPDSTTIVNIAVPDDAATISVVPWYDHEVVTNVLLLRRVAGDPVFTLDYNPSGADPTATLLGGQTPWPVRETDSAWETLNRILDRRRGKGLAYLGWADDSGSPTGAIDMRLYVRPQLAVSLTYTYPAGTVNTVPGADSVADAFCKVDFTNDQRIVDDAFQLRATTDSAVDQLITEGEPIEVAVTASKGADSTIAERWSSELGTAREAADDDAKKEKKYNPVKQHFGTLRTAGVVYKNGDGSGGQRADYWTDADGALSIAHTTVTSPSMIKVMDDLPLYDGWDYSATPPVPLESAEKDGTYKRRKPTVLVRKGADRFIEPDDVAEGGMQLDINDDVISVEWVGSRKDGTRIGDSGADGALSDYDTDDMTFVIGLRMPQRPRFGSTISSGTVRRIKTIRIPDLHLWIAHAGCIYDLNKASADDDGACNARRVGGTIGSITGKILRDDRAALARAHYLAWEWYRSDSGRLSMTWAIRDCGLLPTWTDLSGTPKYYPLLGQVVTEAIAGGTAYTPKTPITRIAYDNRTGVTTWHTDWSEFDYGAA